MGFRTGAFAKVWDVRPKSDTNTQIRISVSRKIPNTEPAQYEDDFSDFVSCVGSVAAKKAANLQKGDRIKLGDVDTKTRYVKDENGNGQKYYNFLMFSFDMADGAAQHSTLTADPTDPQPEVDGGDIPNDRLPF